MTIKQAISKLLKSSDRIFVQKKGDCFTVTNGYLIVQLSKYGYQMYFSNINGLFKDLTEDSTIIISPDKNDWTYSTTDFSRFFENKDNTKPIHKSPFLTDWKTKGMMRLYITDDNIPVYLNNEFIEILETLFGDDLNFKTIDGKEKISMLYDEERHIGILPIKSDCPYKVTFEWI